MGKMTEYDYESVENQPLMGIWLMSTLWWTNIAIENGHRNSGFSQLENGGSFHCYVSSPEGIVYQ